MKNMVISIGVYDSRTPYRMRFIEKLSMVIALKQKCTDSLPKHLKVTNVTIRTVTPSTTVSKTLQT